MIEYECRSCHERFEDCDFLADAVVDEGSLVIGCPKCHDTLFDGDIETIMGKTVEVIMTDTPAPDGAQAEKGKVHNVNQLGVTK